MAVPTLSALPFSAGSERAYIQEGCRRLLETLGLKGRIAIMEGRPAQVLARESFFRRRWWCGMPDAFRDALHQAKFQARTLPGARRAVTRAWREMREHVNSIEWRRHIRKLTTGRSALEAAWLRIAFGAAAQAWTRAARWQAAFGPALNPFEQLASLFQHSCWPCGLSDGALQASCVTNDPPAMEPESEAFHCPAGDPSGTSVFLSAPFRDPSSRAIVRQMEARAWSVVHGEVDERTPPERRLGEAIREAPVTVCVALDSDPEFGLPWWTFQELDFALACGRPVAILGACGLTPMYPGLATFPVDRGIIDERFWPWLESNMRSPR